MAVVSKNMVSRVKKNDFKSRVEQWIRGAGFEIDEVHIRPMKNKWSSCSDRGRLSFSSDLLLQSEEFQREVVMREMLSLGSLEEGRMSRVFLKAFGIMQHGLQTQTPERPVLRSA